MGLDRSIVVGGHKQFDLTTEIRDSKTGAILKEMPYEMHVDANGTTFEAPPKSGMIYNVRGELIKDGLKEKREAEEKAKSDALAREKEKKDADRAAQLAEIAKEKEEIIAQAKAEAEAIVSDAKKNRDMAKQIKARE